MQIKRFGYEIRNGDNRLVKTIGGFETRAQAEAQAERERASIRQKGWNMRVCVTEEHAIS